ncbi:uncharacterized protein SCODWIG_01155 [Saccharomycodes ludwigii]|uniref:Uncharacterized protein n=1 Tax=Saccharomycodes ludwigii TaxID=36035 RepID=A0A376B4K7_9ASCO|nr:uncharacterized protein SCODWIG_01155 [Saccharomycodes ludwigii]
MLSNQGRNNKHPIYDVNTIPNNNIKHPLKSGKIQIGDEKHIFQFLDFSGQKRLESSWKTYFIKNHSNKIDVIIYVLDISDFIKWDQTKKSFQENLIFLEQEQQRSSRTVDKKIPILIIGNKIDNFNGSASYTDNGCTSSTQMFSHKSILLRKNSKNNMYIISDEPGIVSSSVSALSINSTGTNIIHDERDYYNKIVNYVINEDTMYYLENTGILCKQLGLDIQNRRLYYEDGDAKVIELKSDIDVITISCKDCIKINEVILWLSKLQI